MVSPFPGMDPYLEDPRTWESVHTRLIAVMGELLSAQVEPHFYVDVETTIYVVEPDAVTRRQVKADLFLVTTGGHSPPSSTSTITAPTIVERVYPDETRQHYLEVRDTANRAVVATIELLSPANKAPGPTMRDAFLKKRDMVMASPVHWIEIDLLRAGMRPDDVVERSDYYALLKRRDDTRRDAIWYVDLRDRLPTIAVPLTADFADVALDVQAALDLVYERNYYARRLDYTVPPPLPALPPADAAWAEKQVRAWLATT
jgi:hypothetical protein